MSSSTVTFETKVWEGDFRTVLAPARLEQMAQRNCHEFARRSVIINNVRRADVVVRKCRDLVRSGVIDDFHVVADLADEVLLHFGLTAADLGVGYKYSIAELVGLYVCRTEHLLHFSGDAMPDAACDWVPEALELLRLRQDVKVVNLVWDGNLAQVREESFEEDAGFCYSQGFSDQMYLVRAGDFRGRIYDETHPASSRYPGYGGELFEKRVDSWLRNHDFVRAVSKAGSYRHQNIAQHKPWAARLRDRAGLRRTP